MLDGRQASLAVVSGDPSGGAERADDVGIVNGLAVGDQANALSAVGDQEVVGGASRAQHGGVTGVRQVGDAPGNTPVALKTIRGEDVAGSAGAAAVGGGLVNNAVGDEGQARGAVVGEAGEGGVAQNAQTEAVVLDAVDDGSWDTRAPVSGLGEAEGAFSANVSTNNVLVAVGDGLETPVLNQEVAGGASAANSDGGVGGVKGASDDEVHKLAGVAEGKVEALLAVDAASEVVDSRASVAGEADTTVTDAVVKIGVVTLGAVLVVVPGQASCLTDGLLGSGSDQEEAESQLEQVVHVYC